MRAALYVAIVGCALVLGGCSAPYTPTTDRPMELITEFTTQNSLSIVNAQESTAANDIGRNIIANFREWTGVAVKITEREVTKRGARIESGAPRSLSLAVTQVRFPSSFATLSTEIDLRVETGHGYTRTYTGKNKSVLVAAVNRQIDGAMMRVVAEMLRDPRIISYLTE